MTTIVGIQGKNWAVMAADSQITEDDTRIISSRTPKILSFNKKQILIGLRGDARPGDIIAYNWKPPRISGDVQKWVVSKMIPSMIKTFEKYGYNWKDEKSDFNFLVAVKGKIFDIGADMSISTSDDNIYACGSGKAYALGALANVSPTDNLNLAKVDAIMAVAAAKRFDINTGGETQLEVCRG